MELEDLTSRLQRAAIGDRQRAAACPDDLQLAAYVDGTTAEAEAIELHLADCEACTSLVADLSRHRIASPAETVPELVLARARRLGKSPRTGHMRFMPHVMAAAIAMVSVSVLIHFLQAPEMAPAIHSPTDLRVTRNVASDSVQLQLLSPSPGEEVAADELQFRWTEIPGSRYYEIHIVTDAGERVSDERVSATEWRPHPKLPLRPGAEYFVRIDAYPSESRVLSSAHVPFTIADPP